MSVRKSKNAKELIKSLEGFRPKPYWDHRGYTIGYGHHTGVTIGWAEMSREEAEKLLEKDIEKVEASISKMLGPYLENLPDDCYDALVSFVYNVGPGAFGRSTMRRLIMRGKLREAGEQFRRWVFASRPGGKKALLPGLVERRKKEAALWRQGLKKGGTTK